MQRALILLACAGFVAFSPARQDEPLFPDGFDKLDDVAKRAWEKGVDAATKELKDEAAKRLEAAARALRGAAAAGMDPQEAKVVVVAGMDAGFAEEDYKNFGQWVKAQHGKGLKGKALADAIHGEMANRKTAKHAGKGPENKGPDSDPKSKGGKGGKPK